MNGLGLTLLVALGAARGVVGGMIRMIPGVREGVG